MKRNVLDKGYVTLIDTMPQHAPPDTFGLSPLDWRVVQAARVSFDNTPSDGELYSSEKALRLLRYLYTHKHTTPFEMVVFMFEVKAPLFIARQWMRHRMASYSEASARYTIVKDEYYVPSTWRGQAANNKQASTDAPVEADWIYERYVDVARGLVGVYKTMLDAGVAREQARMILPQSMYTRFVYKVDAHNLMHFLRLRLAEGAQWEMRQYAQAVYDLWSGVMPVTAGLFSGETL